MSDFSAEDAKREIDAAVKILREDGIMVSLRGLAEKLDKLLPAEPKDDEPTEGKPPPKTEPKPSTEENTRKSKWWGDQF